MQVARIAHIRRCSPVIQVPCLLKHRCYSILLYAIFPLVIPFQHRRLGCLPTQLPFMTGCRRRITKRSLVAGAARCVAMAVVSCSSCCMNGSSLCTRGEVIYQRVSLRSHTIITHNAHTQVRAVERIVRERVEGDLKVTRACWSLMRGLI